jgi:pantoate--beta-alanine ligase
MEIVRRVHPMKEATQQARSRGMRIGLVPTMGALHEGHLSLIRRVNELADIVVVSIFVNPAQFGPDEDFTRYPRDLARDADLCIQEGVDYLFTPGVTDIYPPGPPTYVHVNELSERLEGASRPGHFRGVTTVVFKLLQVVRPHLAAFGWKDAQQGIIIRRMARDLLLDVEVLLLPIVRDEDGLALSSRNAYLTQEDRAAALAIPRALEAARLSVADGQAKPEVVLAAAREVLEAEPNLTIDYLELATRDSMAPVSVVDSEALLLVAVRVGKTRLLDNTLLAPG